MHVIQQLLRVLGHEIRVPSRLFGLPLVAGDLPSGGAGSVVALHREHRLSHSFALSCDHKLSDAFYFVPDIRTAEGAFGDACPVNAWGR